MRTALIMMLCCAAAAQGATKISFDHSGVLSVDGKPRFVISVALPPPPDGTTPNGKNAYAELRDAGVNYMRVPPPQAWDDAGIAFVETYLDAAAARDMLCWITLRELAQIRENEAAEKEPLLRRVVAQFKKHPANGGYKGSDEPAWARIPVEPCMRVYRIIKEIDPNHPVAVLHAPRFTPDVLAPYMPACDVTGEDIFPVAFPGGGHSDLPNRHNISVVGDETRKIIQAAQGKPVWMTLQIAFSGTARPGKTLRFPTFEEQRFMTYHAIIHGARGVNYFGGGLPQTLSDEDKPFGWNWRYWDRVLGRVVREIGDTSPLYPALLAPESKLPVRVPMTDDVDLCVREVGNDIFIIAAKRERDTRQVTFSGLPLRSGSGEVLFESPRTVNVEAGGFTDWFAPNEVHVYRFKRDGR